MRRTLIIALIALALSLGTCAAGIRAVRSAVDGAEAIRREAVRAASLGDADGARARMEALDAFWREREGLLEMLTYHDALSDVRRGIADAIVCLEAGDRLEFLRAATETGIALEHLGTAEAVRWENLY